MESEHPSDTVQPLLIRCTSRSVFITLNSSAKNRLSLGWTVSPGAARPFCPIQWLYSILKTQPERPTSGFGSVMALVYACGNLEICTLNFGDISQCTADILLRTSGFEFQRPPYGYSTSGSDFDLIIVIGVSFCIGLPNKIEPPTVEVWRHVLFSRCWP